MPESWEKGKKPVELPNPELNPLQNATLGRNLGRWAQVYFTSPPEKREEAVGELLRELQAETDVEPERAIASPSVSQIAVPSLICKVCQQPNELNQSFCGLCGSPLREADPVRQRTSPTAVSRVDDARESAKVSILPADDPDDDENLQWLRERNLGHLSGYDESSGKWKYVLAAVVLLAGTFGVLEWLSNRPVGVPSQPAASLPVQPAPAAQTQAPATTAPQNPAPEPAPQSEPAVVHEQQVRPAPPTVPARMTMPLNAPAAQKQGGAEELSLAQGYLEGKHGRRDSVEAAKWLWKAVAKQNSMADVLLADLYVSGDGVAKSCDQARLLLTAATQKGAPGAAAKLRSLQSAGCR